MSKIVTPELIVEENQDINGRKFRSTFGRLKHEKLKLFQEDLKTKLNELVLKTKSSIRGSIFQNAECYQLKHAIMNNIIKEIFHDEELLFLDNYYIKEIDISSKEKILFYINILPMSLDKMNKNLKILENSKIYTLKSYYQEILNRKFPCNFNGLSFIHNTSITFGYMLFSKD
jgi:hypothetical protein